MEGREGELKGRKRDWMLRERGRETPITIRKNRDDQYA